MKKLKVVNIADILFCASMSLVVAFPNPSAVRALMITVFFLYMEVVSFVKRKSLGPVLHVLWALAFYIYCAKNVIWSLYPEATAEVLNNVQWCMLISVSVVNYVRVYRFTAVDIAKRAAMLGLIFLFSVIMNGEYIEGRFTIVIGDYMLNENMFAQIAIGIACYLIYWSKKKHWKAPLINVYAIVLIVLALISGSRKSIIGLSIFLLGFSMYEYPPKSIQRSLFKLFSAAAIVAVVYVLIMNVEVLYNALGSRIESLFQFLQGETEADASAEDRMEMLVFAYRMFEDKPIAGYGLNTFRYFSGYGAYAHNNYMELLANIGLVGFSIYYLPILVYFTMSIKLWRNKIRDSIVPLCVILVFIFNDFFTVSYFTMVAHLFLALSVGIVYNLTYSPRRRRVTIQAAEIASPRDTETV